MSSQQTARYVRLGKGKTFYCKCCGRELNPGDEAFFDATRDMCSHRVCVACAVEHYSHCDAVKERLADA